MASAQTSKQQITFSSINQVGLLVGSAGKAVSVQTMNGVRKNKSFIGLGVGFDFYGFKTIPLFIDVRTDLTSNKTTPFTYVDGGVNFLRLNFIQKEQAQFPTVSPGLFYDVGLGWKFGGKNHRAMLISAGYSLKQVSYKSKSFSVFTSPQQQPDNYDYYNFLYRRIVIKLGFQL